MAFMAPPASNIRDEDRLPILGFNAKAGRLFLHDRFQQADGEWATVKTDITMQQPAFAIDFGRLEVGWILFSENRAPLFSMVPYGAALPPQPESPGATAAGKPFRFKAGFRVPVIGQAIGGVRELAGNAGALIGGMNNLHTEFEASAEAQYGRIPLVRMANVLEVRAGQSSNYQPVFSIVRYVDRQAKLLGPRTVSPPGIPLAAASPAARVPAPPIARPVVAPVVAPVAARTPPPTRQAPPSRAPIDSWDDEPPARVPPAASVAGWADDAIPY
jgi:hypothetical protein